ncbi:MAG: hypothetical protein QNK23_14200 [Crocinitomicaceae bacterium]|nr:hypothetical protein [Crocinitomicaceae bacterium]
MRRITTVVALIVLVFGGNQNAFAQADTDYRANTSDSSGVDKPFFRQLSQEGVYFDFVRGTTNMLGENFRIPNTVIEIDVFNNNSYTVKLANPMVDWGAASFHEPKPEVRLRNGRVTLGPGESAKLFLYIRTDDPEIPVLEFNFHFTKKNSDEGTLVRITNYNAHIPF